MPCFFLEAVFVLQRALHFVERIGHFGRRCHVFDRNVGDRHAHAIAVEDGLGDLLHFERDTGTVVTEHVLRRTTSDHFAHRAFSGLAYHFVGVANLEQIKPRIGNAPQDRKAHVDDVLIARKHQSFVTGIGSARTHAGLVFRCGRALDALDGPPMEMQARTGEFVLGLPEQQLDAHFLGRDGIDRLAAPEDQRCRDHTNHQPATAARNIPAAAELLPAACQNVLEIGSIVSSARTAWSVATASSARRLAPRTTAAASAAAPIVFPRHFVPFGLS